MLFLISFFVAIIVTDIFICLLLAVVVVIIADLLWCYITALLLESDYLKALLRRAQSLEELEKFEDALEGEQLVL